MQDYIDFAKKHGVVLQGTGHCQFCGAATKRGVHECVEIFNLGFHHIDYSRMENHLYRFLAVDAHTLQHPELHGRWNNHFHLTRLHLVLHHQVKWKYELSPKLSDHLNKYKIQNKHEVFNPPGVLSRGAITTTDILDRSTDENSCKEMIKAWAKEVYHAWCEYHAVVAFIGKNFWAKYLKQYE
ncbi:DUF5946 family protein [Flexithrix dorotheae]|uniref:DUF5946 family protein n=1 Tax=Flexithrix dorotheae TaxID=70993 RepID=UPI000369A22C|nr:DUF5946 family protein [Flexithrix dorotheae]